MARKKKQYIPNRTKIDIVILLLSASTSHFHDGNFISLGRIYQLIRHKDGIKSNRAIRDQVDMLMAQGIAEYIHNRKDVRIKAGSGLAKRLSDLIMETPDNAFPYGEWEYEFLYRGAYQFEHHTLAALAGGYNEHTWPYRLDRNEVFGKMLNFSVVNDSIDRAFLKRLGRDMAFRTLYLCARENALTNKGVYFSDRGGSFLNNIALKMKLDPIALRQDPESEYSSAVEQIKAEFEKYPYLDDVLHEMFIPEPEYDAVIKILVSSDLSKKLLFNYEEHSVGKLSALSITTILRGGVDHIIGDFTSTWYEQERKKSEIVLKGIIGSTGLYTDSEIQRFSGALENLPSYSENEPGQQEFNAVCLELSIKGAIRQNEYYPERGKKMNSPMLTALQAYEHVDSVENGHGRGTVLGMEKNYCGPRSVYAFYEIDQLIGHF